MKLTSSNWILLTIRSPDEWCKVSHLTLVYASLAVRTIVLLTGVAIVKVNDQELFVLRKFTAGSCFRTVRGERTMSQTRSCEHREQKQRPVLTLAGNR
jgi:hypothetical protein